MKKLRSTVRLDILKVICMAITLFGLGAVFVLTPSLSTPTLLAVMATVLLSPMVAALERRGYPRALSILILFATFGLGFTYLILWAVQIGQNEWSSISEKAPAYFKIITERITAYESNLKAHYSFLKNVKFAGTLTAWGEKTGMWFVQNGAAIMGDLFSWVLLTPILSFFLINDGRTFRKDFFHLVPNRAFESVYIITYKVGTVLSDYFRAKLFEALLVTVMTTVGFWIVGAPYAIVLGIVAGITNIIPYVGPIIGSIPGVMVAVLDPTYSHQLWPMVLVYSIANLIDMTLIFPLVFSKLVNLHPLILMAAVMVGQTYYGLVGMLLSIPIAAALKVVFSEIYTAIYQRSGEPVTTEVEMQTPSY